jgi:hypothetical protein
MLIIYSFYIIAAIVVYFDLEIKQFDIVNIFINIKHLLGSILVAC